jgi:hypothetical protein
VTRARSDLAWKLALALGTAALVALRMRDGTGNVIDDAYMTLRNAKQLALGNGLVYNAGEPCLGTTTPLYALLHGAVGALVGAERIPWSAVLGNALADALAFWLIATWIAEAARSRVVGLASAALYAFSPRAVEFSTCAMEAPLYTLFILATLREASRGDEARAGLAAGLAQVCRPDGGLVGAVALAFLWLRKRSFPARYVAVGAAVVLPWLLYALAVFPHGPIPQSLIAKSHRPWAVPPDQGALAIALELAAWGPGRLVWVVGRWLVSGVALPVAYLAALPAIALALLGARTLDARGRREGSLLLAFLGLYAALFAAGNPLMLGWYQVPIEALVACLVPAAVARLVRDRAPAGALPGRASWPARALLAFFVGAHLFWAVALRDREMAISNIYLRERWDKTRERTYFACADRLVRALPHDAVVQASENGVLGWAWPGRMLDTVGLDTPGAEKYYPLPPGALRQWNMGVPAQLVLDMKPDAFVTLEIFVRETCLEDAGFRAAYELDEKLSDLSSTMYGSRGLLVFRRRARSEKPN